MRSGESTERITASLLWSQDQLAVPSSRSFKVFKGRFGNAACILAWDIRKCRAGCEGKGVLWALHVSTQ